MILTALHLLWKKLGDILRYLLYETTEEKISISSELAHLEDFIELVRLRVKEKNWLTFDVDGRTANLQIAPMLFLPLVENACKFAPTREGEKSVAIQVFIRDNQLTFMVENKISENSPKMDSNAGIGLKLVRRRLELIYPGKHNLIVKEQNNRFKVELKIELDA